MTIDELVQREAPEDGGSIHDTFYAAQLRRMYNLYSSIHLKDDLDYELDLARQRHRIGGGTHANVAACVVLYELLNGGLT